MKEQLHISMMARIINVGKSSVCSDAVMVVTIDLKGFCPGSVEAFAVVVFDDKAALPVRPPGTINHKVRANFITA